MSHSPSPQRRRVVAYGEEPPPPEFKLLPITKEGVIVGFTMYDPTGRLIRYRDRIAVYVHEFFPDVTKEEVENAQIGYEDYVAHISLPGRMRREYGS